MARKIYVKYDAAREEEASVMHDYLLSPQRIDSTNHNAMAIIHERIVHKEYQDVDRISDILARMFAAFSVCAAVSLIYNRAKDNPERKVLKKILIGHNATLPEERQKVIESIWSQIWTISQTTFSQTTYGINSKALTIQKFNLISDIMSFPEYKVATNYGYLCNKLFQEHCQSRKIKFFDDEIDFLNITKLLLIFVNYGNTTRAHVISFNHMSSKSISAMSSKYAANIPKIDLLDIERIFKEVGTQHAEMFQIFNVDIGIGISQCFLKLHFLLGEIISHIQVGHQAFKDVITKEYNEYGYLFGRAIQDATTISFRLSTLLPNAKDEVAIEYIANEQKLHAEIVILQHRIIEKMHPTLDNNFVDVSDLLDDALGVSKLSCGWCWMMFNYMNIEKYLRGCHGAIFDNWHRPFWKFEERIYVDNVSQPQEALGPYGWGSVTVSQPSVVGKKELQWDDFILHITRYLQGINRAKEFLHLEDKFLRLDTQYLCASKSGDALSDDEGDNYASRVIKTPKSNATDLLKHLYTKYLASPIRISQVEVPTAAADNVLELVKDPTITLGTKIAQKIVQLTAGLFQPKLETLRDRAIVDTMKLLPDDAIEDPDLIEKLKFNFTLHMSSNGIYRYIFNIKLDGIEELQIALNTDEVVDIIGAQ